MAEQITLDVIDRPAEGIVRSVRRAMALRRAHIPGVRAVIPLSTSKFVERPRPAPTPRRFAVLAAWDGDADAEAGWGAVIARLAAGAGEHWHVRGEVVRASFTTPWRGWLPATEGARPLDDDEPALVLISGNLKPRHTPVFVRDAARVVAHANRSPGYLGGLGVLSSPMNTTSCSAWRTYADTKRYAFAAGPHAEAMRRDRAGEHHRTEWFLRIRPVAERGTLDGRAPFGATLDAAPVAAVGASR